MVMNNSKVYKSCDCPLQIYGHYEASETSYVSEKDGNDCFSNMGHLFNFGCTMFVIFNNRV